MKTRNLIGLFLMLMIALSAASPALAAEDKVPVLFKNVTGETVTVYLRGPEVITVTLQSKGQQVRMQMGTYSFSYKACGRTFTGTLKVNRKHVELFIKKCHSAQNNAGSDKTVRLVMINKTGAPLYLVMTGTQNYRFYLPVGKTPVELLKGRYQYSISGNGCGQGSVDTGNLNVRAGYSLTWFCDK